MDFFQVLIDYTTPLGEQTTVLVLLFAAVLLIVVGTAGVILYRDPIYSRLTHGISDPSTENRLSLALQDTRDRQLLHRWEKYITPRNEAERTQIRELLFRAGFRRASAVGTYYAIRALFGLCVPIVVGLTFPIISRNINAETVLLLTAFLALCGLYLPVLFVAWRIRVRQRAVRLGFPDTLDLMLVCVEAGLGLDAAFNRVAEEIKLAHPIIAEEFVLCSLELRAGKGRQEVLRDFAKRVGVDDVRAFVAVLLQSDRFGTSVAESIRVYAAEMRSKRMLRAEEKANKLPLKLALAAIVCTLPPTMLILISPALIAVLRMLTRLAG
jgi:tight adherence protein C